MNCNELQESLAQNEDGISLPQQVHLKSCLGCSALVSDLQEIRSLATDLRMADEPSPRVWNSLEIALRAEGLIRTQSHKPFITSFGARWGRMRWLVPVAAAVLIAVGVVEYRQSPSHHLGQFSSPPKAGVVAVADLSDTDFMQTVSDRTPAVQAEYTDGLRSVNDSIQDAQAALDADPGDQEARRALMEAYQQKQMLFNMAEDRPLP
jgi:hypothetical protein